MKYQNPDPVPQKKTSPASKFWVLIGIPVCILLLNFIYKILYLGARDINIDEPFTLFYSQMPLQLIMQMLPGENNPPLFFLLMHGWIKLVGIEPFQVRLVPFIFGTLSSVVLYFLGNRHFSRGVGISAAMLFTFSNFNTYLAQEVRVYSLFVLLSLLSVYFFLNLLRKPTRRTFVFLVIVNILLLYSHFFAIWILLIECIYIILFPEYRKRFSKPFLFMGGALLLAFLPYLMIFIKRFLESTGGTWLEPPTLSSLYNLIWKFCNQPVPTVIVISTLIIGFSRYMYLHFRTQARLDRSTRFLLLWFLFPMVLTFLVSFMLPVFYEKYLVFISPALYLLVSQAVVLLSEKKMVRVAMFLVLSASLMITSTPKPYYSTSVTQLSQDLKSLKNTDDPVLITPGYFDKTLAYTYNRSWFINYQNFTETLKEHRFIPIYNAQYGLSLKFPDATQLFLVEAGSQYLDPAGDVLTSLKSQFDSVEVIRYDEVVRLYVLKRTL